jgi:hypothetical protein
LFGYVSHSFNPKRILLMQTLYRVDVCAWD